MKKKILVVDDEDDILHFLELVLREKGYEVATASGGHEALTRAQIEQARPGAARHHDAADGRLGGAEAAARGRRDRGTSRWPCSPRAPRPRTACRACRKEPSTTSASRSRCTELLGKIEAIFAQSPAGADERADASHEQPATPARATTCGCAPSGCASRATSSTPPPSCPRWPRCSTTCAGCIEERGTVGPRLPGPGRGRPARAAARLAALRRRRCGPSRAPARAARRRAAWARATSWRVLSVRSDKFLVFLRGDEAGPARRRRRWRRACDRLREQAAGALRQLPAASRAAAVPSDWATPSCTATPCCAPSARSTARWTRRCSMSLRQRTRGGGPAARRASTRSSAGGRWSPSTSPSWTCARPGACSGTRCSAAARPAGPSRRPSGSSPWPQRTGRLLELERLCRRRALRLRARATCGPARKLFLNTSARALRDPRRSRAPASSRQVDAQGLRHADVVLEITRARCPWRSARPTATSLRQLKRAGLRHRHRRHGRRLREPAVAGGDGARLPEVRHRRWCATSTAT